MKKLFAILALLSTVLSPILAQGDDSPFRRLQIIATLQRPPVLRPESRSAQIKAIQSIGAFGTALTADSLYITRDAGITWVRSRLTLMASETMAGSVFLDRSNGYVIAGDSNRALSWFRTENGGLSWQRQRIELPGVETSDAEITNAVIEPLGSGQMNLEFRVATSSNFVGRVRYTSLDDGVTWTFIETVVDMNTEEPANEVRSGDWILTSEGRCEGFKTGCYLETKIEAGGANITPPQIVELSLRDKQNAVAEAAGTPMFATPPGGSTRISLNRGFDKCQAGSVAQMQLWWDNSYFHDTNIYFSGRARACPTQPFTNNPAWINSVSAQGWGLIPTVVGYQAPCSVSTTVHKFSSDAAIAETQGRGEADIAATDALSIGLTPGSVIYYDMERYNDPGDGICRTATIAFLKGWTERIHELGYISGVYGSPSNAVPDWWPMPAASRMDAIWMARWDNVMSVWVYNSPSPAFPAGAWENHQRIKQWQAPHNETWGGVTFNIDGNISDGPVAGIAVPKNRNADFDGDLKTDLSVWRPDNGGWYVSNSSNGTFSASVFGVSTDIPVPGDYDGDGKTDRAVFRPGDGVWHFLTKGNIYGTRTFGTSGDIPAPADYNADGKTDVAVFRPSTGVWYIANSDSQGTVTIAQFGADGDKPVPADYDGDGEADIGIFRPNGANGAEWWIQRSSLGLLATQFGSATDKAVEGDYTGDGKADVAFFTPSNGFWYVLRSDDFSYFAFPWGTGGDIPSPGDFDGDGKDDASVFRPTDGNWYVNRSTAGVLIAQFGAAGDKPVPAAYLPQ